jgi:spoIIIJ-associated protein
MKTARSVLTELLDNAGVLYSQVVENTLAGQVILNVEMENPSPWIGSHGDTVRSIDTLVKRIVENTVIDENATEERLPLIDVGGYRTKLITDLQEKARAMAERAKTLKYDVELSPMSAYERLIVHATLQGVEGIKTSSTGEGRDRRVVIRYIF